MGTELNKYPISIGNMTSGNYKDVMSPLDGLKFSTRDSDNDLWYQNSCAEHYKSGWWLTDCGFDPNRAWCNGNGCMTWGDINAKKIVLKVRPMIGKGVDLNGMGPVVKPRIRVRNPPQKNKKKKSKKGKKGKKAKAGV